MKVVLMTGLVILAVGVSAVFAQNPMREGRWEVTTQMQMPNMPMPEMKQTSCVTKEQLKDPAKAVPSGGPTGRGGACKVSDYKTEASKVTWKMACDGGMNGTGEMTFKGDTYEGNIAISGGPMGNMTMKLTGKRVGDCQ